MGRSATKQKSVRGSNNADVKSERGAHRQPANLAASLEEAEIAALEQRGTFSLIGDILKPKTKRQAEYLRAIRQNDTSIIFGVGPAGTGKTYVAMDAAIEALSVLDIKKIIITRPAVEAEDENLGFMPGELNEKFGHYLVPLMERLKARVRPGVIEWLMKSGRIEAVPMAFMRGRTFDDCWILADEAQNTKPGQMKMLLTRIGTNSKVIVDGDTNQSDIRGLSGLVDGLARVGDLGITKLVKFTKEDCVRSETCKAVLACYEDHPEEDCELA